MDEYKIPLCNKKPGETILLGNDEYIILVHKFGKTSVISKNSVCYMSFGENPNYIESEVRKFLNSDYYEDISNKIGKDNILSHKVELLAEDGSNYNKWCYDNVSMMSTHLYRRYRRFIDISEPTWTSTPASSSHLPYRNKVCYIDIDDGIPIWDDCSKNKQVRAYMVINSNMLIDA